MADETVPPQDLPPSLRYRRCEFGSGIFSGVVSWISPRSEVRCATRIEGSSCEPGGLSAFLRSAFEMFQEDCQPDDVAAAEAEQYQAWYRSWGVKRAADLPPGRRRRPTRKTLGTSTPLRQPRPRRQTRQSVRRIRSNLSTTWTGQPRRCRTQRRIRRQPTPS